MIFFFNFKSQNYTKIMREKNFKAIFVCERKFQQNWSRMTSVQLFEKLWFYMQY